MYIKDVERNSSHLYLYEIFIFIEPVVFFNILNVRRIFFH